MRAELEEKIVTDISSEDSKAQARAAYIAICLELDQKMKKKQKKNWKQALAALQGFDQIPQVLFHHSPVPAAKALQEKALAAGIKAPEERRRLWE